MASTKGGADEGSDGAGAETGLDEGEGWESQHFVSYTPERGGRKPTGGWEWGGV